MPPLPAPPPPRGAGRELYKRNLALLVPFLWDAAIELRGLQRLPPGPLASNSSSSTTSRSLSSSSSSNAADAATQRQPQQAQPSTWWRALLGGGAAAGSAAGQDAPVQLLAEWQLTCWLRLPWAPYVRVNGTTTYTLNADQNKVGAGGAGWWRTARRSTCCRRCGQKLLWRGSSQG